MVIDAYEYKKVANFDIPGEYLQTDLSKEKFTLLLLEGKFVDIMRGINPDYKQHVTLNHGRKTFYIHILKVIYGIINSDLLWYELYLSALKDMWFQLNPYDMCVANKDIEGRQCNIS